MSETPTDPHQTPAPPAEWRPALQSVVTWALAGVSALLLIGVGVLSYLYANHLRQTDKTIADQRAQIQTLQATVDSQKKDLTDAATKLHTAQADLADAAAKAEQNRKCADAVQKVVDANNANNEAAGQAAALEMIVACGTHL